MIRRIGILHGAGYTGGELVRLVAAHPDFDLFGVTSRSNAGRPVWQAHEALRGVVSLSFTDPDAFDPLACDGLFIAAEHGQGAVAARTLDTLGYEGVIVDLSADFRLEDPAHYEARYGTPHPAPSLASRYTYGMPDLYAPYGPDVDRIANPGCFATGLALSLAPFREEGPIEAVVTALTGASGSGVRPTSGTHFPRRDGNVRAYKVLAHQHMDEVYQVLGQVGGIDFVPVSGPWTRGIWGTVLVRDLAQGVAAERLRAAYEGRPLVRLWPNQLPELRYAVGTPFCDIGWIEHDGRTVIGFALDNLLKGAASQAVHNMNLLAGLPETAGLLPPSP